MTASTCWCTALQTALVDNLVAAPFSVSGFVAVCGLLGLACLVYVTLGLLKAVLSALIPHKALRKYGEWAIVTGATDGIGLGELLFLLLSCFVYPSCRCVVACVHISVLKMIF